MTGAARVAALLLCGGLAMACPDGAAAYNDVTAGSGGVAAGRDITGTVNIGLSPAQVKELTEAAARGATGPLTAAIVDLSKRLGVTEDATRTLLRIVGEQDVPLEHLSETLGRVANDYRRLQAQAAALNPENPTARTLVTQAKAEIEAGHLEHAHGLLRQATQAQIAAAQKARQLREQAQAAEDAQMRGAAASTATEGEVAVTEGRYELAAELFGQAAGYAPAGHPAQRLGYLDRQAHALWRQGDERGDNDALRNAIQLYRTVLVERARDRLPLDWAMTQINLGTALTRLGEHETDTARLEEAVVAFRAALEEYTRDRAPLDWAMTQLDLGTALQALAERNGGSARLEEAVAAYRGALEVWTRDRRPLQWAAVENNLGTALAALGVREGGTTRLEEAAAAFRATLEERTRERVPLQWAETETNLGVVLETLGTREDRTAWFEEAATAFRAALAEFTRDRVPLRWAATQNNLGATLARLGVQESKPALVDEGITAIRAALEERTRERVPLDWASTQFNLGIVLAVLGMDEGGTAHLEEAVAAWDACLTVAEPTWPPERLQALRERREEVQSEIKRRSAR